MKSVYESSTSLEAHMILNLLSQEGVSGRIDGEYLQGGVGELQAMGFIRVLVPDDKYEEATNIIRDWESKQPPETKSETKKAKSSSGPVMFVVGTVLGVVGMYFYYSTPVTTGGIDYNSDGVFDEKWFYKNNRITRTETDRNFDGNSDFIYLYNHRGIVKSAKSDDDFDGFFETKYTFKDGNIVLQESDLNRDGKVDYISTLEHGVLKEAIIFGERTGSPKKRQYFELNKLTSAEFDSDGDGVYETQYEYDYFEEQNKSNK